MKSEEKNLQKEKSKGQPPKKYNPNTRKHEFFVEKNYHHIVSNYFFLNFYIHNQQKLT